MTIEEFEQASEIYRKYDEIEDIIERIKEAREEKLVIDERTKKDGDNHKKWWQKLRFFSLRFKGTRMVVMPHYEFAHGIEVDADPELIELIIDYFEKKKDHYKQQVPVLLASLESMINILHERGIDVVDWDDKSKKLVQFRVIGGKAYFFAASDNKESDKNGDSKE